MPSNLKPVKFSGTGPAELKELVKKRIEEEHYKGESAYVMGLILYDLFCRRPHRITSRLMAEPSWVRDKAIEQIIEDFKADRREGRAREDSWLDRRLKELIAEVRENDAQGGDRKDA